MTKRQRKRRTFLTSLTSLILSVAMLVGTTFSWFTGSASNTGNRIVTGTLKVQLLKHDGTEYKDISDSEGDIFVTDETKGERLNGTLWEPGKTEIVYLAVKNAGNLALNYNIVLDVKNAEDNTVELEKALSYAVLPGMTAETSVYSWENIKVVEGAEIGEVPVGTTTAAPNGALLAGEVNYFALAVHMDENAGNEYQDQELLIDVKVEAKQMPYEYDSFSNLYDAVADVTEFGSNFVTSSTPNAEATLYSEFVPKLENGTVYSGVIGRLGHTVDGTPYLLFAQQENTKPGVVVENPTNAEIQNNSWTSANTDPTVNPHWIEVTFGQEEIIDRIEIYHYADRNFNYVWHEFTLYYMDSVSGEWKEIETVKGNTAAETVHEFDAVTTRAIRAEITDKGYKYRWSTGGDVSRENYARLNAIEVYNQNDENVALTSKGATATADSVLKKRAANNAIDGDKEVIYKTQVIYRDWWMPATTEATAENPHWLMVDLGEAKEFNEIHINGQNPTDGARSWLKEYQLQYNANPDPAGEPEWVTLASDDDNMDFDVSASFPTVKAQQIRLYVTKTNESGSRETRVKSFAVYNRTEADPGESLTSGANVTVTASSVAQSVSGTTTYIYAPEMAISNYQSQYITCLTAVTLDGEILWQKGTPVSANYTAGEDLPVQIYDIDQDSEEEVITVYNDCIQVFSPDGTLEGWSYCENLNADAIIICNVTGKDYKSDIIVKDRYREIVTFEYVGNGQFKEVWRFGEHTDRATYEDAQMVGHFPAAYDIDGDGKDEIMTGNTFLDHDGTIYTYKWEDGTTSLANYIIGETELVQHADGIKVGDFDPDNPGYEILLAHSLNGNIFVDVDTGERYCFDLAMGHSQKIVVGEFAPTIPGLESFTTIKEATAIYLQKANGERIWPSAVKYNIGGVIQADPSFFIMAGSGQEYLLANRLYEVIDAYNNPIVSLPTNAPRFGWSVNVCGDEREEIVLWSNALVQIWTNTAAVPDGGKNLVADATITTDSTANGSSADSLKDGDRTGTMWVSGDGPEDHWIVVDFGSVKTFDELWLYGYETEEETFYLDNFKIQYNVGSAKNPQWVDIHDVQANMRKEAAFTFDPVTAQQVRILITDPTTAVENVDSTARVCEIEIYEALSGVFSAVEGTTEVVDNAAVINFGDNVTVDGVSVSFDGAVTGYDLQYYNGTEWIDLASVVCNTISVNNYAFTPVSTNALRVVVTEGEGTVASINAREWSGYDYQEVVNEIIINPTKSGNTGSYKWTQY